MIDSSNVIYDCIILGSGPAGNTAAIYLSRAGLKPLVLAGITSPGGALTNTTDIENYPGFPDGIAGAELVGLQQQQAEKFGANYEYDEAKEVELDKTIKTIHTELGVEYTSKTVIIATGSVYRKLNVEGEAEFAGRGVSYCATCDGFFFKDKDVVVVGGGDTAMEEALYLANICRSVKLIHRRDVFRASNIMIERVKNHKNIEIITSHIIKSIASDGDLNTVSKIIIENTQTNHIETINCSGVFVAIGADPQTKFLKNSLELNEGGYIKIDGHSPKTSVDGVFAAGDCSDGVYNQAIVAAGSGAKAAIEAERFLCN